MLCLYVPQDGVQLTSYVYAAHSQDVAFVRRHRGLEHKIEKKGQECGLKVEVEKWTGGACLLWPSSLPLFAAPQD